MPLSTANCLLLFDRLEHRQHILHRCGGLDVMNGVKDKATSFAEDLNALAAFAVDLLGGAERKCLLRIGRRAPEGDLLTKFALQHLSIHAFC